MKHSDLISFFYKNKNEKKWNSTEITQTYARRKNCNKTSKYEQPLYNFLKNIDFAFSP